MNYLKDTSFIIKEEQKSKEQSPQNRSSSEIQSDTKTFQISIEQSIKNTIQLHNNQQEQKSAINNQKDQPIYKTIVTAPQKTPTEEKSELLLQQSQDLEKSTGLLRMRPKKFSTKFDIIKNIKRVSQTEGVKSLLNYNKEWAEKIKITEPQFFKQLSEVQNPKYLWIGCSDSRVPAERLTGLGPGDLFVHRNVANQVIHTDLNCLSVVQYAVEVLKVSDIIICGHYKCGGVHAAVKNTKLGLINNWLHHIRDIYLRYKERLDQIQNFEEKCDKMCELNVIQQIYNLGNSSIIQDAWEKGQQVAIHAWIYDLEDGLIEEIDYAAKIKEVRDKRHDLAVDMLLDDIQNCKSFSEI
ncbi:hypothetical protein IMG5_153340 [Ichthyophthirius multifiliis]|uniref:Carbonic anhydrase n=1 Tax=Ichthyophthirius multifiliis TaxID=5932 RepID=G0QYZ1_ICHMU|nr:hypothetical protein IMG5_153340 [Ichthyophthirius multifiliis]EGR29562.1 hypothetical protein IMG5_153340 [Ichthyophthirius multifiliis]|eukprot:XP_004030798.1 hypothetical protein IMG5_153340 [Ichthyophthirius multifiliis]